MASSVDQSLGRFPPVTQLHSVLLSTAPSIFATKAFADVRSGYPQGLRAGTALSANESGHFEITSGLTIIGNAATVAQQELDRIQELKNKVDDQVRILSNPNFTDYEYSRQRLELKYTLKDLDKAIKDAGFGDINLLDKSDVRGISLNLNSGQVSAIGFTPTESIGGHDRTFDYNPDELKFEIKDIRAAFKDFSQIEVAATPDTDLSTENDVYTHLSVNFQKAINDARDNLKSFKKDILQTAVEKLTITEETSADAVKDGSDARQIASRLAQQLASSSFAITATPVAKYFSLFT